ncbi:MAG: glycosyltransferase [Candidatus Pacebacteria bacterium]|nr:glycosyltransferase [Candidatus Paceibacterota bacterium]
MSAKSKSRIKTAIVYDKAATTFGGAEQVLLALHQRFPKAPLLTSVYQPKKAVWAKAFPQIFTSFLQKIPFASSAYRWFLPLMPLAFESLDLSEYDLIISVTSGEAKGIITKPDQFHLCYLLTPPRYLYSHRAEYLESKKLLSLPGFKWLTSKLLNYLVWWDQAAIHRPDLIIPISQLVAQRVKNYYKIEPGPVVYPPVDVAFSQTATRAYKDLSKFDRLPSLPTNYFLVVSRLVAYKQIELAIQACLALGQNLIIVGQGPEMVELKVMTTKLQAEPTSQSAQIVFLGNQPQEVVNHLYQGAEALLMPAKEDFGITALQANYFGTPAVLHQQSGAAEIIKDQQHAVLLKETNLSYLIRAIEQIKSTRFNSKQLKTNAQDYTTNKFLDKLESIIEPYLANTN